MSHKKRFGKTLFTPALVFALVLALLPAMAGIAHAYTQPSPPFSQCPSVGADTSCGLLIVINPDGSAVVLNGGQPPFDNIEDTLVGVQNNSPIPLTSIPINGAGIFGFDGDGLCNYGICAGSTGYEGPNTTFTIIDNNTGAVNFPTPLAPGASTYFSLEGAVNAQGIVIPTTALAYTGATSSDYNDPATVSAQLTDHAGTPLANEPVVFTLNGAETCTGTTDASGNASCSITPGEAAGPYTVVASFAGDTTHSASTTSSPFAVTLEETALTSNASLQVIAQGHSATISAVLTDPNGGAAISGKPVVLTLGSGSGAQQCTGTTDSSGTATCSINSVTVGLGPQPVTDSFAGDSYYQAATLTASSAFGNGSTVTWWGAQWNKLNTLSGGSAPSAFKGFAKNLTPTLPSCGGTWTTSTGDSPPPPSSVPSYMAVVVPSKVTQSGSTIAGDIAHVVIVKTNPGYDPNAGHAGTGTVVAQAC